MNSEESISRVMELTEQRGLTHANFGIFEVNGSYRAKRYNTRHLKKAMTEGIAWIALPSGLDPGENIIETSPFADPANGYRDAVVTLDADSCREIPFDSGGNGLLFLGNFMEEHADHCPRTLLQRELARMQSIGFDVFGGFELEGTLLAETPQSTRSKTAAELTPVRGIDRMYSFVEQSGHSAIFDELIQTCELMDMPLDTIHAEYINMIEVGMKPSIGIRIADDAALYKNVSKIVAARHDAYISFMAKIDNEGQGAGAHINISLRDTGTGNAAFYDDAREDKLSDVMRCFLGGLNRYLPELFLLLAPHLNSYKRFQPELFTPLSNTWAINNKTVAFRALNTSPSACRIEVRPAGADMCPHLAMLAVVAAGRMGIEQKIQPPEPVSNGYDVETPIGPTLPLTFDEAISRFAESEIAKEITSEAFASVYVSDRRWQQDAFSRYVTDWEVSNFSNL